MRPKDRVWRGLSPALLFAVSMLCAPASQGQPGPKGPPAVGVVAAKRAPITEQSEFIGRVQATDRVALVARVTAFLDKRLFAEGSEVKRGDMLYRLQQGPFQADLMAKQAALGQNQALLRNATLTRDRQQALLNTPAGQRAAYDTAVANQQSQAAQVLAAQANLQNSEINLGYTEIRAPIDGKISRTLVTEGNVVSPTTGTLATIVSQDPMYVLFPMASRAAFDLRDKYAASGGLSAVRVRIRLPGGDVYDQQGKLDYIDPTIAQNTDTVTARAVLPNPLLPHMQANAPGNRALVDGEFVQVLIQGATPVEMITIPRAAILSDQQGDYVFTVNDQNVAERTNIQLGQSTPTVASVASGLAEGARVVVDGIQRIKPGEKVAPGPANAPPPGVPPGLAAPAQGGAAGQK